MAKKKSAATGILGEQDVHLFREGTHGRLYQKLGCQLREDDAVFSVWAPNAEGVSVIGDFNDWRIDAHPARPRSDGTGIWEVAVAGVAHGQRYKFAIRARNGELLEKADPFARFAELAPATGSIVWKPEAEYQWDDAEWLRVRPQKNSLAGTAIGLRSAPGLLATRRARQHARLPRGGRPAGRVRDLHGLHARRADADHRAPVLWLVGLPDDRLLRGHVALRHAGRLQVLRRQDAPGRHRR